MHILSLISVPPSPPLPPASILSLTIPQSLWTRQAVVKEFGEFPLTKPTLPGCLSPSSTWNSSTQIRLGFLTRREGKEHIDRERELLKGHALLRMKFPFFLPSLPPISPSVSLFSSSLPPFLSLLVHYSEVILPHLLLLSRHFWEGGPFRGIYKLSVKHSHSPYRLQ